jgi:hypothetical protein
MDLLWQSIDGKSGRSPSGDSLKKVGSCSANQPLSYGELAAQSLSLTQMLLHGRANAPIRRRGGALLIDSVGSSRNMTCFFFTLGFELSLRSSSPISISQNSN